MLYWRTQDMAAVRRGRWKFVRDENLEYLFDLSSDPADARLPRVQSRREFESLQRR